MSITKTLVLLFGAAALAGCQSQNEMTRYDGVTTSAGDAIYANTVMQMVDPWPEGVQDTDLEVPADRGAFEAEPAGSDAGASDN